MATKFDVIGDIHGFADALEQLLTHLGYQLRDGIYRHSDRRALFLGDFIDRGEQNRRAVAIVRRMVDAGHALAIMGNHEYNAICYHTRDPHNSEHYLRAHSEKNRVEHRTTLAEFDNHPAALASMVEWFKTLPLFIECAGLRAVHACWHGPSIEMLRSELGANPVLTDRFLVESCDKKRLEYDAIEAVLKGLELDLPDGIQFQDQCGHTRNEARIRWWLDDAQSLDQMVIGPPAIYPSTAGHQAERSQLIGYHRQSPPVFFGHYWLTGTHARFATVQRGLSRLQRGA